MENLTENDFQRVADLLGIEVAVVKAVQAVETGGHGGFVAPGRPMILFEGHIFWRELKKRGLDPDRYVAGNENILYPKWEKGHYYGGMKEYERLEKAREIHKEAADASFMGMFRLYDSRLRYKYLKLFLMSFTTMPAGRFSMVLSKTWLNRLICCSFLMRCVMSFPNAHRLYSPSSLVTQKALPSMASTSGWRGRGS